ncbi:IS3 family transposase [Neisseria weixii]
MLIERNWLRKGWCKACRAKARWDNAPMESFFGTLKESFYQEGALSVAELTRVIDDCIRYYNHERISLNLKKLSSVGYRTQLEKDV